MAWWAFRAARLRHGLSSSALEAKMLFAVLAWVLASRNWNHVGHGGELETVQLLSMLYLLNFSVPSLGQKLPLSGRQGAQDGAAESVWKPVHLRGWLDSHLRVVNSSDMQFQTQRRNHLQYCCQLRIARRG